MPGKRHHLKDILSAFDDEQIIEDLRTVASIRDFTKIYIGHGRETAKQEFHGAIIFYFKKYRPEILQQIQDEAEALAANWPNNYSEIGALNSAAAYWYRAVKRRFRQQLRLRFRVSGKGTPSNPWKYADAEVWLDAVWPLVLQIHKNLGVPFTPAEVEYTIYRRLYVPTRFYRYEYIDPNLDKKKQFVGKESLVGAFNSAWRARARDARLGLSPKAPKVVKTTKSKKKLKAKQTEKPTPPPKKVTAPKAKPALKVAAKAKAASRPATKRTSVAKP